MVHEPRGVVALLVPWNDPVAIACGQLAAALVTGNAVVFKPSEKTPLSGARLVELLDLPAASSSCCTATPAPAGRSPRIRVVDLVIHTGSVQTGREVAEACVDRLGKALLELGGKDAMVVDAGVDPEWAAEQARDRRVRQRRARSARRWSASTSTAPWPSRSWTRSCAARRRCGRPGADPARRWAR